MTGFDAVLNIIGDITLYAATLILSAVIVYYHLTARWWATPEGRHIMSWTFVTWAILLFLSSAIAGFLGVEAKLYVRIIIYGLFIWLGGWRFSLIVRAQKVPRPGQRPSEVPPFGPEQVEQRER